MSHCARDFEPTQLWVVRQSRIGEENNGPVDEMSAIQSVWVRWAFIRIISFLG